MFLTKNPRVSLSLCSSLLLERDPLLLRMKRLEWFLGVKEEDSSSVSRVELGEDHYLWLRCI